MVVDWFFAVLDALTKIIAIAALIDGVRRLTQVGFSRKALLTALFGAVMCSAWAGINYFKYWGVNNMLVVLEKTGDVYLPAPEQWSPSLSPEQREEIGRGIAGHEYFRSGNLKSYLDKSGSMHTFVPSQKQVSEREASVARLAQLQFSAKVRYGDAIEWLMWGVFAALIGFLFGKMEAHDR